jgi:hypothetical protein
MATRQTVKILIGISTVKTLRSRSTSHKPTTPPRTWIVNLTNLFGFRKDEKTTNPIKIINKPKKRSVMVNSPIYLSTASYAAVKLVRTMTLFVHIEYILCSQ